MRERRHWMILLLPWLWACGYLTDQISPDPQRAVAQESGACVEATIGETSESGCRCIRGGTGGVAWVPHWGRPFQAPDGGATYLHGSERWCPKPR